MLSVNIVYQTGQKTKAELKEAKFVARILRHLLSILKGILANDYIFYNWRNDTLSRIFHLFFLECFKLHLFDNEYNSDTLFLEQWHILIKRNFLYAATLFQCIDK